MKTVVVIPTYDEKDNVRPMAKAVLEQGADLEVLFVDDNSPDVQSAGYSKITAGIAVESIKIALRLRFRKTLALALALAGSAALAGELTVAPEALTPSAALARIRAERATGDTSVWKVNVRGFNTLTAPLTFTAADHDIDFVGEAGATFSGGTVLTGWRDSGSGWWEADCPRGADGRPVYVDQLWIGGRRANRARLPDEGYLKISRAKIEPVTNGTAVTYRETAKPVGAGVAEKLAAITKEDMPYAQLCVIHKWSFARRILRGYDAATGRVETWSPSSWHGWQRWEERSTLFFFENVRAAFDAPGEWYQDMAAGKILYRPLPGETVANLRAVAPFAKASRLVDFRGDWRKGAFVRNITFRNIAFSYSDSTRTSAKAVTAEHPDAKVAAGGTGPVESWQHQAASASDGAITLTGVSGIRFLGCEISHTGNYAFRFDSGCTSNVVAGCRLTDIGAGGIWMGADYVWRQQRDRIRRQVIRPTAPDAVAFNLISNCTITCGGRYNPEGTGVALTHCSDTKVVHNDIRDFFYTGVSVGWTWGFSGSVSQRNEIGWNRISDLGKSVMSDMGGVYTLGTSFGTRVHHNVIHDVRSYSYGGWALYCDEGSEGIVMEDNLCWNTTDGGFHQHYGTGCIIRNNVFAFNRELGAVRMARATVQEIPCTLHFVNNIVYVDHGPLVGKGVRNVGGVWANNVWYDARGIGAAEFDGLKWAAWSTCGKERGSVFADPKFADAAKFDFTLAPDSPALKLGFVPFDLTAAGPAAEK